MERQHPKRSSGEQGNVLLAAIVVLVILGGLGVAQFAVAYSSLRQSEDYKTRAELQRYAQSGLALAAHEFLNDVGNNPGLVGTANWQSNGHDLGADGIGGTSDSGEDDGIPTPGEQNVPGVAVGPPNSGMFLMTYVTPTTMAGVELVVSTCFTNTDRVTVQRLLQEKVFDFPRTSALYIHPGTGIGVTVNGNSFGVSGNDTNPDGTPGPGTDLEALVVGEGLNPGDSVAAALAQIPVNRQDQFVGVGGDASVGETAPIDVDELIDQVALVGTNFQPPGSYDQNATDWGDYATNDLPVTVVNGDVSLEGQFSGAGVLVVDGNLTMSGQSEFMGVILVRGDVSITGGGAGVHTYGSVMMGGDLTIGGQADCYFSSAVFDAVESSVNSTVNGSLGYESVYYGQGYQTILPVGTP